MMHSFSKSDYTVTCVSEFAARHGMTQKEAFQFLYKYGAIAFVKENYEIEHTLSYDDVMDDMLTICQQNGGTL